MSNLKLFPDKFDALTNQAKDKLKSNSLSDAYNLIIKTITLNPDAPQPHNLLGIWNELNGDKDKARKHYRAAYALDPTFKPACNNLERICTDLEFEQALYDYGDGKIKRDVERKICNI